MFPRIAIIWCALVCALAASAGPLVRVGESWQVFKATSEPPGPVGAWRSPGYDAKSWLNAISGFSTEAGYYTEASIFPDFSSDYIALYVRKSFQIADTNGIKWLTFRVDYNDAFIAYINGKEVARRNLPDGPVNFTTAAASPHLRGIPEEIDLTAMRSFLVNGENVLAVQVHGQGPPGDYNFSLTPELLANFIRGPVLQNAATNHVQVIWKTPYPASTIVQYGATTNLGLALTNTEPVSVHAPMLAGLLPDTVYYYRAISSVGGETVMSPIESFRTLKMSGGFSFTVAGDLGQGGLGQFKVAQVMRDQKPDFAVLIGDIIYPYFRADLADIRHFSVYEPHMKNTPFFYAPGNHDSYFNTVDFFNTLYLPTNNMTGTEQYYSLDHGDAHFVMIDSDLEAGPGYEVGSPQYQWLEADLAASRKPWKFIFMHHTMRTSSYHRVDNYDSNGELDTLQLQRTVGALAEKYGVTMTFSGHDHVYERFNPVRGLYSMVTGGGGAGLYGFSGLDPDDSQFYLKYHCTKVTVDGPKLLLQAIDLDGQVFDTMTIYQTAPTQSFQALFDSPMIESKPADDGDGNVVGQRFNLRGTPIPTVTGKWSNLGQVYVANDLKNLYVGVEQLMIGRSANLFLFIESPRLPGVKNLLTLGNGQLDPDGQGADGLDFLGNLSFTNFTPSIGCILGDEMADSQYRFFARPALTLNIGQGIFYLDAGFSDVPGSRFAQFNRSPQGTPIGYEQNANFVELSIPLAALGPVRPGDTIKIAGVAGLEGVNTNRNSRARNLDTAYLGRRFVGGGMEPGLLEGLEVKLAIPDVVQIRVEARKAASGQNPVVLTWSTNPGKQYTVQVAANVRGPFQDLVAPGLPMKAAEVEFELSYQPPGVGGAARTQFFRVRELP